MPTEITTAVGRLVWGHPGKSRPVIDRNTKQPKMKQDGTPRASWSFGVAFDKATFQATIWPALAAEAQTAYQGGQVPGKFAWKYVDGDGVDDQGKPFNQREGYAGCYILSISTELQAPGIFKFNGAKYDQLPAEAVKCGDYVAVGLLIKVNVPPDRSEIPSLYINPQAIELVGYGTEIVSQGQADPNALFGGRQHQLPAGASATPIGGVGAVGMPGMGGGQPMMQPGQAPMQQPGQMPMGQAPAPAGGYTPQAGSPMMPPPATDFVQNAGMPPQPGMMPMQQPGMMQPGQAPMQQPGMMPMQQPGMMPMQQPGMMPGR